MTLSLFNFQDELDARLVKKGQTYYEDGAVEDVTEEKPGTWYAQVTGTDVYDVEITLKKKVVTKVSCDCPHDAVFCKHVIAVLFALLLEMDIEPNKSAAKTSKQPPKTKAKAPTVETILKNVSEKDLKEFVQSVAAKNKEFRTLFMIKFELSQQENSVDKFRSIIKKTAGLHTHRGFIDWGSSKKALRPARDILDEAQHHFKKGNYRITFEACQAVIAEVCDMIQYMDDSNGMAGDCISTAFDWLLSLCVHKDVPFSLKDELFAYALCEYDKPNFGFHDSVIALLLTAAYDKLQQQQVLDIIEGQLKKPLGEYEKKALLDTRIHLLQALGRVEEAEKVLQENASLWQYREQLIQQHITKKNYKAAKALAEEGIKDDITEMWTGNRMRWIEWLLKIARLEKDIVSIRKYCRELYFKEGFNHKYYKEYQNTFTEAARTAEYEKWVKWFLDKRKITYPELYALAAIYISEKRFENLLVLVQKNPIYAFAEYANPYLKQGYAKELLDVFRQTLIEFAASNTARNHYVELCNRLKSVQQIPGGKPIVQELVGHFLRSYKNRPAMTEELKKLTT